MAIEHLCAVQALHLSCLNDQVNLNAFPLGKGTAAAFEFLKNINVETENGADTPFDFVKDDTYLHSKIVRMQDVLSSGKLVLAIEKILELQV
jgi:hypothetical protein